VVGGGKQAPGPARSVDRRADPFKGGFRVLITGSHGFERAVFALDDDPAEIADRVRETLEE